MRLGRCASNDRAGTLSRAVAVGAIHTAVSPPSIISRRETRLSDWVRLVEKDVDFGDGAARTYHSFAQADYVGVVARTPSGLIPIVRQFRPAIEQMTWELPAGLVDPGEDPAAAA